MKGATQFCSRGRGRVGGGRRSGRGRGGWEVGGGRRSGRGRGRVKGERRSGRGRGSIEDKVISEETVKVEFTKKQATKRMQH